MAAQVEQLSREDYEHAIARIFYRNPENGKNTVVGTGFLVAPGYVLTCAHVVLQSLGVGEDDWHTYQTLDGLPRDTVTLQFLSGERVMSAQVVAWQPYDISQGDVAGLKLLEPAPEKAIPIPITRYSCTEISQEQHLVYGFASPTGGRSDAYQPKSNVVGGRFQFHKVGDPQDDTIAAGFSGAPVWNEVRSCVVGMIATVRESTAKGQERRDKAYAIPEKELYSTLQLLFAHHLSDLIEPGLKETRCLVQHAVGNAFLLCDEGRAESENLLKRLQRLTELSNRKWTQAQRDVDRLTQFAIFLMVMDGLPKTLRQELKDWVCFRGFNVDDGLYRRANEERQDRQVSSNYVLGHLIVQVKADEQNAANVKVWIWVIGDRNLYDPLEPPPPRLKDKVVLFDDLPQFLESWIEAESNLEEPTVHCFVARHRLGDALDARETQDGLTLGNQYKLVMRTDLSQSPTGKQHYTRWKTKWNALEEKQQSATRDICVRSDCSNKGRLLKQLSATKAEIAILENLTSDRVEDVFKFLASKVALPVALWSRRNELCPDLDRLLEGAVIDLPERVYQERLETLEEEAEVATCLGYHVSLVWEDFKIIPPTMMMQFDQEAC